MTYCPPRLYCERCFAGPLEADRTVGPEGVVESFSVGYAGIEGEPLDEPITAPPRAPAEEPEPEPTPEPTPPPDDVPPGPAGEDEGGVG